MLKEKSDKTQYFVNQALLMRETYSGKFDEDLTSEPPAIKRMECYVGFEKGGLVISGTEYGQEPFGEAIDLFRESYMVALGEDYRVVFDMMVDKVP